jgi:hypothetical protein
MSQVSFASRDFPRFIKTLYLVKNFEYWGLVTEIYKNAEKAKTQDYFNRGVTWVHLDRPCPTCPELENDWRLVKDLFVTPVEGKRTDYTVNEKELLDSPLKEYATDDSIQPLIPIQLAR